METKVYVNDYGTVIILDCGTDITSAIEMKIKVYKPDRTLTEWTAIPYDDTHIKHTVLPGELDLEGNYLLQAYVSMPDWVGRGASAILRVHGDFK